MLATNLSAFLEKRVAASYDKSLTNKIHCKKHPTIEEISKTHHKYEFQFQDGYDKYVPYSSQELMKKKLLNFIKFPKQDLPLKLFHIPTKKSVNTEELEVEICYAAVSYIWKHVEGISHDVDFEGINWEISSVSRKGLDRILNDILALGFEYVWIDVLCINQNPSDSKNAEVAQMHNYYAHSSTCVVYLESPTLDMQFDLEGLTNIPTWFTRVWTLQEGWIPMQCLYLIKGEGENALYLTDYHFFHFINSSLGKDNLRGEDKKNLEIALNCTRGSWIPTPLNIKEQLNLRNCHEIKDKFFGVLGLNTLFMSACCETEQSWDEKLRYIKLESLYELDIEYGKLLSGEPLTWWLMCNYFEDCEKQYNWQNLKSDCMPVDHSGCVIYTADTSMIENKIHMKNALIANVYGIDMIVLVIKAVGREWKVEEIDDTSFEITGCKLPNGKSIITTIRAAVVRKYSVKAEDYIIEGSHEW
ncbi:hypothetical protein HK096_006473, partial [Nowakowskiella sp. JEL0078]